MWLHNATILISILIRNGQLPRTGRTLAVLFCFFFSFFTRAIDEIINNDQETRERKKSYFMNAEAISHLSRPIAVLAVLTHFITSHWGNDERKIVLFVSETSNISPPGHTQKRKTRSPPPIFQQIHKSLWRVFVILRHVCTEGRARGVCLKVFWHGYP